MSIIVQDQIVARAEDVARIRALIDREYLPAARARGLEQVSVEVSPPVATSNTPINLWVRWSLADSNAFWAMRAQSATAEVANFWQTVDDLCVSRCRTYLMPAEEEPMGDPPACDTPATRIALYRETAQLALKPEDNGQALASVLAQAAEQLPGVLQSSLGQNLAPEYAAGHFTWDVLYEDAAAAETAQTSTFWQEQLAPALDTHCNAVHALALDHISGGLREPGLAQGVKRTAFFRLLPGIDADVALRYERDLLDMPLHIPAIRNWRLSRARPAAWHSADVAPWTYVWEQEFTDIDGLTGPYMAHPHHWSYVDRWFDPESGEPTLPEEPAGSFLLETDYAEFSNLIFGFWNTPSSGLVIDNIYQTFGKNINLPPMEPDFNPSWVETDVGWVYMLTPDWGYSVFMGTVSLANLPWIYQTRVGWLYLSTSFAGEPSGTNYWFYHPADGWLFAPDNYGGYYLIVESDEWKSWSGDGS